MAGRLRITVPVPSRVTVDVHLDEAQGGELLQRDLEQFDLRAGIGDALAPVARVRLRRLPDEREQLGPRRPRPAGQVLGDQQRDVPFGALLGHPHVGELVVRVHHGDALGAQLRQQPGGLADPPGDVVPLGDQVGTLVFGQLVVVNDRVVEQPPGEHSAQRLVAQFVGLGDRLGGQLREPCLERAGADGRRAPAAGQQHAEYRPAHVVQHVGACRQVRVLVPGDPAEHAPGEQQPDHGHEVGAVAPAVQRQREPGGRQAGFGGGGEHVVGEAAERGLRVGAG